ncbi:hypothetical protein C0995_014165 [Termitomyces sp. Mi166|nr:hypothetical protein C0995_014165 [Termitomyces sp. Mi166\
MATLMRLSQTVQYTAEGAVTISYPTLVSSPLTLNASIEEAFGSHPKSLGIIIVRDLPASYASQREKLLKLAYKFAKLDESAREKYADPASSYSFGWSHGKEIMNGKPDVLKGSYYANPTVDAPTVSDKEKNAHPEYYGNNICVPSLLHRNLTHTNSRAGPDPDQKGVEGFEDAFKDLGRASQTTKARLLHYFPPAPGISGPSDDEPAMYLQEGDGSEPTVISSPSPASGLYIRTRGGDLTKVSIPPDCLAFQTGEALEIATGGKLRATPHCVRVGVNPVAQKISRETFALFMQPNTDQHLSPSETFGQFSKKVLQEHYKKST